MNAHRVIVVGGGAAGFFAAIACAETNPEAEVWLVEKSAQFLSKVRISGGGRCNVTHACFDPREFAASYPRGHRELIGPFQRFSARDTVNWFESRGVKLKAEADGRMFPVTDSSQTIIDCLTAAATAAGVKLLPNRSVEAVIPNPDQTFEIRLSKPSMTVLPVESVGASREPGAALMCQRLLLASGGCRAPDMARIAVALGHSIEAPVPSLFTFNIQKPWLRKLAGVSVPDVEVAVPGAKLRERGPLLLTHWGVSGPGVLRLSAWGARKLHDLDYTFPLSVNWLPRFTREALLEEFGQRRNTQGARLVVNAPIAPLTARLWEALVLAGGIARETRWAALTRAEQDHLVRTLSGMELPVSGKSLNKDEFVTCGGVRLREVDFKRMESRVCPGLHFAGELLDIDGITGGFNFQAAWTTGWIAGKAMADSV
jgi:predicted Rossmann fold flavoprotein